MVVEADESDGSFLKLPATIAVVTNIDPEHMEFYGSEEALHRAFDTFVENLPFFRFAVPCIHHPEVQKLLVRVEHPRILHHVRLAPTPHPPATTRVDPTRPTTPTTVTH